MSDNPTPYSEIFARFASPLMMQLRQASYRQDIGQHSWTNRDEMDHILSVMKLGGGKILLDAGCGAGGPLVYAAEITGCAGVGVDYTANAWGFGEAAAEQKNISDRVKFHQHDLATALPYTDHHFDGIVSIDVVIHFGDRVDFLKKIWRVLKPNSILAFSDAGIIVGAANIDSLNKRSSYGANYYVPKGFNEACLTEAGFSLLECLDTTANVLENAQGRWNARQQFKDALLAEEGQEVWLKQEAYLKSLIDLTTTNALARHSFIARKIG